MNVDEEFSLRAELSPVIQRPLTQQHNLPFPRQIPRSRTLSARLVQTGQRWPPVIPRRLQRNRREKGRQQIMFVLLNYHDVQRFNELIHHQDKLEEWLPFRNMFLDEILRHDGLGGFLGHSKCAKCEENDGIFKCKDCPSGRELKCQGCMVSLHQEFPLHRVEVRVESPDIVT
jgi:hypothetical protein